MGICNSTPSVDDKINKLLVAQPRRVKLLLLGTGESGKSTIFKQLQLLNGKVFTKEDALDSVENIHKNVMENFFALLAQLRGSIAVRIHELTDEFLAEVDEFTAQYDKYSPLTPEVGQKLKYFWNTPSVQHCWSLRAEYQIMDALGYFLTKIDEIASPEYLPVQLDVLSSRVRSSGILEHNFTVDGTEFDVVDVGGQRNERNKWIHCFDGVTGIIFVVAISEYDQVLFEDKHTSRVAEALTVFKAVLANSIFFSTPIILLLNKNDVFEEKIVTKPFSKIDGVPEVFKGPYAGDPGVTPEAAITAAKDYMTNLFLACNTNPDRKIYTYFTTALDDRSVSQFFEGTKAIVTKLP